MNAKPIEEAQDEDVRNVPEALRQAARRARETAIQTNTDLILVRDGRIVRVHPSRTNKDQTSPLPMG